MKKSSQNKLGHRILFIRFYFRENGQPNVANYIYYTEYRLQCKATYLSLWVLQLPLTLNHLEKQGRQIFVIEIIFRDHGFCNHQSRSFQGGHLKSFLTKMASLWVSVQTYEW